MAWWGWAIGLAVAASLTTNPLVLALILAVTVLVVVARRTDSPWAKAFRLYLFLGLAVVLFRVFFHLLVGLKFGDIRLFWLPSVSMPEWAAGVQLGGTVYLEGLLGAILLGAKLGVLIVAVGAANALANPKRLLRAFPRALHEIGTAVVVAVSVAPQLAESVQRVMRARQLRGEPRTGLAGVPRVALPVLQDTLDRSLQLASAMESRGYGGHHGQPRPRWVGALTLGGLMVTTWGLFGLLSPASATWWTSPVVLAVGVLVSVAGLWAAGRAVRVSTYRPDRWGLIETVTLCCGLAAAATTLWVRHADPLALQMPLQPLSTPALPWVAVVGILAATLPAFVTPPAEETS